MSKKTLCEDSQNGLKILKLLFPHNNKPVQRHPYMKGKGPFSMSENGKRNDKQFRENGRIRVNVQIIVV